MSAATAVTSQPDRITALRRRASATETMIAAIDDKIARLALAKRVRATALNRVRCELARENEPVTPEHHEPTK